MKNRNFQIVNLQQKRFSFQLLVPLAGSFGVHAAPASVEEVGALAGLGTAIVPASLAPLAQSAPGFETFDDVQPKDGDYIYPLFRALSKELIPGHWIDFSEGDVLEESVPLLFGQTVFKNHNFYDVERWLGAVNQSVWDAEGAATKGVPGINAELKIDWKVNPLIARGLLMKPPAVHSVSVTVLTEVEYSHPELAEDSKWTFYDMLGEEVNGSVVRFIVKKILAYWEISLVFQGADMRAKGVDDVSDAARDSFAAQQPPRRPPQPAPAAPPPATPTEETHTVKLKLTPAQKLALGLTADGEEFEVSVVLGALEALAARAAAADTLLAAGRAECLRVATLAEVGEGEALPEPIAEVINNAGADQLTKLTAMYAKRAAAKFTQTCPKCGVQTETRSSVEALSEGTGGAAQQQQPTRSGANRLHY